MNNITSQTARPPACPVTYGTRTHGDTEEPRHSRISTIVTLQCRKPARGAKERFTQSHSALINTHPETKAHACPPAHILTIAPLFFPLHPSSPSRHVVWSKAFPVHLLSPVRWLSNKSCSLVGSRWEQGQNLFGKAQFGLNRIAVFNLHPRCLTESVDVWSETETLNKKKGRINLDILRWRWDFTFSSVVLRFHLLNSWS